MYVYNLVVENAEDVIQNFFDLGDVTEHVGERLAITDAFIVRSGFSSEKAIATILIDAFGDAYLAEFDDAAKTVLDARGTGRTPIVMQVARWKKEGNEVYYLFRFDASYIGQMLSKSLCYRL